MNKKKGAENSDLTRIEDLSEFLHQKDSDLDSKFDTFSLEELNSETTTALDLDELDESDTFPELPETSVEEEIHLEASNEIQIESFDFSSDSTEEQSSFDKTSFGENPFESSLADSATFDELEEVTFDEVGQEENQEEYQEEIQQNEIQPNNTEDTIEADLSDFSDEEPASAIAPEVYTNTSEKFEDIKTFAKDFTYGSVGQLGGNPPFTIIARNIKYLEDAENILDILSEYNLIDDTFRKDTQRAMELGSLIIPQISEFLAIVVAHKLRRFDLDLQVGLSDEVHPSKLGLENPRGLIKKDHLKQNKSESLRLSELNPTIKDIIISTTASLPGHVIESYIGVQTTFTIVEEAELEKLQYVARTQRDHSELFDYSESEIPTEQIFQDYQNSFEHLYDDLTMQLKQKAFVQNANALLGLSFQLSPIVFERSSTQVNAYQITCSATLAIVTKDGL